MKKGLRDKAICIALLSLIFCCQYVFAQAPSLPSVNLIVQPGGATTYNPIVDTFPPFTVDTAQISLVVVVQDTTSINTIHVSLGSTSGGSDFLLTDFSFDGTPPSGTTYQRIGNGVYLGLGKYSGFSSLYSSVSLVNASGTSGAVNSMFH